MQSRLPRLRVGVVDQLLDTDQHLFSALQRLRIGASELGVGKRKVRLYLVAPVGPVRIFCSRTPTLSRDPPSERRSPISHCPPRT
jgi:hypothetical protein